MNFGLGIPKFLQYFVGKQTTQQRMIPLIFTRLFENSQNNIKFLNQSILEQIKSWGLLNRNGININSFLSSTQIQTISNILEKSKNIGIEDSILNINTHQRKKAKVKREKRQQRRKKIRRLSERKREKYNY